MNRPAGGGEDGLAAQRGPWPSAPETGDLNAASSDDLLPGEDPSTVLLDDAEHWCRVYWELLSSRARMLGDVRQTVSKAERRLRGDAQVAPQVSQFERLLKGQTIVYRARLGYWQQRRLEMAASKPDRR